MYHLTIDILEKSRILMSFFSIKNDLGDIFVGFVSQIKRCRSALLAGNTLKLMRLYQTLSLDSGSTQLLATAFALENLKVTKKVIKLSTL